MNLVVGFSAYIDHMALYRDLTNEMHNTQSESTCTVEIHNLAVLNQLLRLGQEAVRTIYV